MFIPGPSFAPLVRTDNLDDLFAAFTGIDHFAGGVAVYGAAAAYALVWELGSKRLKKPGPKTTWGINRNGDRVILTKQAPSGYIGINASQFGAIIQAELATVKLDPLDSAYLTRLKIEVAVDNASQRIAAVIRESAPIDTGQLRSDIQMIDSSESDLLQNAAESDSILII